MTYGYSCAEALKKLSHQGHGEVLNTISRWTSEMNHIILGPAEERTVVIDDWICGFHQAVCPQQKSFVQMKLGIPN